MELLAASAEIAATNPLTLTRRLKRAKERRQAEQ
jgi:hypothetical protein